MERNVPPIPELPDLTGQVFGTMRNYVAAGGFGSVYQCDWRRPTLSTVKVAVKVIRCPTTGQEIILRRLRREARIWAYLAHKNIVPLYGTVTVEEFGPFPALVSLWIPHGTLHCLIADNGTSLSTRTKLNLLHDIASGLHYLHSFPIVHGDLTSSNVLVDFKEGEYKACLTDFGLSTVLDGLLNDPMVEPSTIRHGAFRWIAPELLHHPADIKPTEKHDIYSFGRVIFHVLTLLIPWDGLGSSQVLQKLLAGEEIRRPEEPHATPDLTDTRWNMIKQCWSVDPSARPSASMAMTFLKNELLVLKNGDVGRAKELGDAVRTATSAPPHRSSSQTEIKDIGFHQEQKTHEMDEPLLPSTFFIDLSQSSSNSSTLGTTSLDQTHTYRHNTITEPSPSMLTKNIVLFGQTGAGKSSVVNLMAGNNIAKVSPDMERCTLHWKEYPVTFDGHDFKVFDTVGFEEPEFGVKEYLDIITNAYNLFAKLRNEGGIHLLLFCVRAGRFSATIQRNYRLVYELLCEKKVPIVLVLTGLEREHRMDDWWTEYKPTFDKYKIFVDSHACITAACGLEGKHRQLYEQSRRLIHQLVIQYTYDSPSVRLGGDAWYRKVARKLWEMTLGKIPRKKNIETILIKRCGMPPEAAKELAVRIKSDLLEVGCAKPTRFSIKA